MARVKAIYKPSDCPDDADPAMRADFAALFSHLFPGASAPEIDRSHAGIAIAALNPKLALNLAQLSRFMALDMPWCQRGDLRELAILTLNLHFQCDYAARARLPHARTAGISDAQRDALPDWRTSDLFDEEQRLVIDYTIATISGTVSDTLFAQISERYGEKGAVEFTAAVAWWSFWAMFLKATGAQFDP
jgi:alkylhydroperoxidase family enzyme